MDYASWVRGLTYQDIEAIAQTFLSTGLSAAFSEHFGDAMPENINTHHRMIIVASDLDDSSERIVRYLAEEYQVDINVIFFSFFQADGQELLGRAWLMAPEVVEDRAEKRRHRPW